eukprot:CFRG6725T1
MQTTAWQGFKSGRKTAGAIIIGNEILSGKFQDVNSYALGTFCTNVGLRLKNITVVEDDYDDIIAAVEHHSEKFDYVFTSGGIGSTHDDITYDAIAKSFGVGLKYDQGTLDLLQQFAHTSHEKDGKFSEAHKRMALFPEGSEVLPSDGLWVPLVVKKNVHILPGVPVLFSKMLELHRTRFEQAVRLTVKSLWTKERESDLAAALGQVQANFPHVSVGSYPRFGSEGMYGVLLSFESESEEMLDSALNLARETIKCEDEVPAEL